MTHPGTGWQESAACADRSTRVFFPHASDLAAVEYAQAICATCPVATECRAYAHETGQAHGIWGGVQMDAEERRLTGDSQAGHYRPSTRVCPCGSPFTGYGPQKYCSQRCLNVAKAAQNRESRARRQA